MCNTVIHNCQFPKVPSHASPSSLPNLQLLLHARHKVIPVLKMVTVIWQGMYGRHTPGSGETLSDTSNGTTEALTSAIFNTELPFSSNVEVYVIQSKTLNQKRKEGKKFSCIHYCLPSPLMCF